MDQHGRSGRDHLKWRSDVDDQTRQALEHDRLIDITTTGRNSGEARRIEIGFTNVDGHIYITGRPGRRSWYANLLANPSFTFHLKQSAQADVAATATPVRDGGERRRILGAMLARMDRPNELDAWVEGSPLVEVQLSE